MKKIHLLFLAAALLAFAGCASMRLTPEEKAAIEAEVQDNLDNRTYTIDVDQMTPRRGMSKSVTNYSLEVDGDKLISHLPYFGQAWNLPYGGGKGMSFDSVISDYIEQFPKADSRQITLATNNGEDTFVFVITVYTNGTAYIDVRSRNREPISYRGTLKTNVFSSEK